MYFHYICINQNLTYILKKYWKYFSCFTWLGNMEILNLLAFF